MSETLQFEVGQDTSKGLVRDENQDDFGWLTTPNGELLLVADGMGGSEGGRLAAETAINGIRAYFDEQSGPVTEMLRHAIQHANSEVHKQAVRGTGLADMGTTIVVLVVKDGLAYTGHVGDSRIYLQRNNTLTRLTKDHSKVQKLVDAGKISEEEAETHEDAHLISRCIGCDEKVEADVRPDPIIIQPGDAFLLCSDGLSSLVKDEEISLQLNDRVKTPNQTCQNLVALALERGGHDNVTVQLIRFTGQPASVPPLQTAKKQHPITEQPKPATAPAPVKAPPHSSSKNLYLAIGTALLALLLLAGGYLFFRGKPEPVVEPQPPSPQAKQQSTPRPGIPESLIRENEIPAQEQPAASPPAPVKQSESPKQLPNISI